MSGRAAVYRLADDGDKLFLRWGVPGDVFGLAMILRKPPRYLVTVEAVQESCVLAWDLASSRALASRCPSLSKALSSVVAGYLEGLVDLVGAYAFQPAQQRIARSLVESAKQLGRIGGEGIALDLTNEQLALVAHMSLFTISRQLSKWQKLGILKKRRGKIVLPSRSVFEEIAKGTGNDAGTDTDPVI